MTYEDRLAQRTIEGYIQNFSALKRVIKEKSSYKPKEELLGKSGISYRIS